MAASKAAATELEELQGEPRWSSIRYPPHPCPAKWSHITDEKLMLLVTQSTASGERFPVGVNWLEVSRVVRRSPVDCVKRYAYLHDACEQYDVLEEDQQVEEEEKENIKVLEEELEEFLLDSGDEGLDEQSLSNFATPVTSPKLQPLDTFGAFVTSRPTSPESPPPFAVARPAAKKPGTTGLEGSPFRWESLVNDPKYIAPVLASRPSLHHKQSLQGRIRVEDDESKELFVGQHGMETIADRNNIASVLTHAFKGLKLGAMSPPLGSPLIGSPRLSRKISNSEYPFLKEEDLSVCQSAASHASSSIGETGGVEARTEPALFVNDAYRVGNDASSGDLQRQMNTHLMRMSAMSSFHGDNPFSGSITQSALEDAFLDMAGSRLDASNVLRSSRMSASPGTQSQHRLNRIPIDGQGAQGAT
ncbi:unnamed protein product [Peronospora farinosa]|uniref:Myb-like domain-containing protein n=1 Tax=Peronospora farinosa TaxID=134698 RepID=A0AAV0SUK1_9STRA|nr:unnamed protein product [Peronospora farinosa]CAI5706411.1 unnamed protein product [Peronospora farinosa]